MRFVKSFFKNFHRIWFAGLLWLVTSLPVFTIGASTTALIYVEMQIIRGTLDGSVASNFYKSFKVNFKHCTVLFLVYAALYAGLFLLNRSFGTEIDANGAEKISTIGYICYAVMAVLAISLTYIFAVPARFTNPFRGTVIYAFVLAVRHIFTTVVIIASWLGISYLAEQNLITLVVLAAGGISILFYLYSIVYCLAFISYIPKDMRTEWEQAYADKKKLDPVKKDEAEIEAPCEEPEAEIGEPEAEPAAEELTWDEQAAREKEDAAAADPEAKSKLPRLKEKGGYSDERPDLSKQPTGTYPRGRKHSMADIIAATSNEADDDDETET